MIELKCGTKIKWCEPYSMSIKEGIIVNVYSVRRPDTKLIYRYVRFDTFDVVEVDTGFLHHNIHKEDITLVLVDGEWVGFKYYGSSRSSGRYPWEDKDVKVTKELLLKLSMDPKQVIFNGPATIVLWKDGTKTIVKRREGEPDDKEKAVMYCILKKLCGNKATMDKYLKLFIKEESNDEEKKD